MMLPSREKLRIIRVDSMRCFALCFLLALSFVGIKLNAQGWKQQWTAQIQGDQVCIDNLGSAFIIKGDQLFKLKENGQAFRQYSNKSLGNIHSIDVKNPLKILLFYKDFSRLVFLDNTITENGSPIFLEDYNLEFSSIACSSYDNGFWIFDPVQYRLVRFNQNLQISSQVLNLNQILGKKIQPIFMLEQENHLFLSDPAIGILRFDIFGNYINSISIKGIQKFQVNDHVLTYIANENEIIFYNLKTQKENKLRLPQQQIKDYCFQKNLLAILIEGSLFMYKLSE